jgi:hypothetical protein
MPNVPGLKRSQIVSWVILKQTTHHNKKILNWSVVRIFIHEIKPI